MLTRELLFALLGTGFTCLATVLGAGMVFFFKKDMSDKTQKIFLGFAAGVMIAASVWSLLLPAMEMAETQGKSPLVPVGGGFILGGAFLMLLDQLLPHLHIGSTEPEGLPSKLRRTTMIVLAVTLHNIPEGMAVGILFAGFAAGGSGITFGSAMVLSVGVAVQNFPEGAIISMPLVSCGLTRKKAFLYGVASGAVEPLGAALMVACIGFMTPALPYILAFAAGAMMYVVVEELIPETQTGKHTNVGAVALALGFVLMMILDVALG